MERQRPDRQPRVLAALVSRLLIGLALTLGITVLRNRRREQTPAA
jgi:hypothetical protein